MSFQFYNCRPKSVNPGANISSMLQILCWIDMSKDSGWVFNLWSGICSINWRPPNLDEIIDKIPCWASTAKDFIFQIKTSDVEEWTTFLIVLVMWGQFCKLWMWTNCKVSRTVSTTQNNFQQSVYNLFFFNWMENWPPPKPICTPTYKF